MKATNIIILLALAIALSCQRDNAEHISGETYGAGIIHGIPETLPRATPDPSPYYPFPTDSFGVFKPADNIPMPSPYTVYEPNNIIGQKEPATCAEILEILRELQRKVDTLQTLLKQPEGNE